MAKNRNYLSAVKIKLGGKVARFLTIRPGKGVLVEPKNPGFSNFHGQIVDPKIDHKILLRNGYLSFDPDH